MADIWIASDGGNTWVGREGGRVPAVADPVQMSVGDVRTLTMDFGNLPEFWGGGGINLGIPPVVNVMGGSFGSPFGLLLALTSNSIVVTNPQAHPVVVTDGSPIGLTLAILEASAPDEWIGAYYVEAVYTALVAGTYVVSVTVVLMDGTKLTRAGTLIVQ